VGQRDDDRLIASITTGLTMIARGVDHARQGDTRFWAYDEEYYSRSRPKSEVAPAGPPDVIEPLIARIDRAASEQPMAYEALLTAQEVADFLGLQLGSVRQLVSSSHVDAVRIGQRLTIRLGELRRYLEEGPSTGMTRKTEWRPLIDEFPGRAKLAQFQARRAEIRAKYDAVFWSDLEDELGVEFETWQVLERLAKKGIIETFRARDYNSYPMVKRQYLPAIKAYLEEERERRERRKAERAEQKKEPRIKL
jgi:excisionase family DNA binding protein